ncbi:MAG: MMPL family transporter [Solirubrobacteraceae bacterium]
MSKLLTLSAGRRSKWVVLALWFAALFAIVAFGLPTKYTEAEKNESTSFLPGDAESTAVLEVTKRLQGAETAPTVVVYQRDSGLTDADRTTIGQDLEALNAATAQFASTTPFQGPEVSPDGTTALVTNVLRATGESDDILEPVEDYREVVEGGDGLQAAVGGPAGASADAIEIFTSINGTLLLAAGGLVFVLLILIYRSPFFLWFPLLAVIVAEMAARGAGYGLTELGITVNGQTSSIASVLVLGAGTDYALLLVSRYREELRRHTDKHEAMALALRRAGPAILASGLTVAVALLSLSLAKVNGTSGMGPVAALSVFIAMLAMLTFLPALLTVVGRRPFWPFVPHFGDRGADETQGLWRRLGDRIGAAPRRVAVGTTVLLGVLSLGLLNYSNGLTTANSFRGEVESVQAQELIAQAFPSGQSAPTDIVVSDPSRIDAVVAAASQIEGVAGVAPEPVAGDDQAVQLAALLRFDPYSTQAFDVIPPLREAVRGVAPDALVGGPTAVEYDLRDASAYDTRLLIPIALAIVTVILVALLRSLLAPALLIATVVLSFLAAMGVGAVVFDVVFGFPGADPAFPLFAFIFLVALGVDYNIFLMARVREEVEIHGTREGMKRGLAVTGGVITSAGVVLAGTFAVLAVLPLTFLTEIGFVVAFGVLLDTLIVRSILVPALVLDIGPKVWWPSRLAHEDGSQPPSPDGDAEAASAPQDVRQPARAG